jgi:hypothetical protein
MKRMLPRNGGGSSAPRHFVLLGGAIGDDPIVTRNGGPQVVASHSPSMSVNSNDKS